MFKLTLIALLFAFSFEHDVEVYLDYTNPNIYYYKTDYITHNVVFISNN